MGSAAFRHLGVGSDLPEGADMQSVGMLPTRVLFAIDPTLSGSLVVEYLGGCTVDKQATAMILSCDSVDRSSFVVAWHTGVDGLCNASARGPSFTAVTDFTEDGRLP